MEPNLAYRFQCALALPLAHRCRELSLLIEECSFKDVHTLFPLLVENVFGFGSQPGWGLNIICHLQPRDFDAVRNFLSPEGIMMRMVEKLMNDVYLKYEFPVSCLPLPVRHNLEYNIIPSFYNSKLQISTPGKMPLFLSLNPFEFYIFHLTYFLIGSHNHKTGFPEWTLSSSQSLYSQLIEDYLHYFLPCDGSFPPTAPYFVMSPIKPSLLPSQSPTLNTSRPFFGERTSPLHCLFKKPSVARQISSTSLQAKDIGPGELWRTEIFTQMLIEFWLNHYSHELHRNLFPTSPEKARGFSSRSGYGSSWNGSSEGSFMSLSFTESFFPSSDHIRLVRMFVKHIHYFSNSSRVNSVSAFDEFKRAIIPQFLQKKLYNFIKHMFDHWPLDASFRLVLEMWLSYIQPWRYGDIHVLYSPSREKVEEKDRVISSKWKPFIEENLVFYSVFFRKMIPRLLRVDLSSPKNASMLHRLSKVFSQVNLKSLIKEAEELQQDPLMHSMPLSRLSGQNIFSKSAVAAGHASIIRQHINDLEGQTFVYVSMFHEDVGAQVLQLLHIISQTRTMLSQVSKTSEQPRHEGVFSSLGRFIGALFRIYDETAIGDGFGINGARVDQYLEYAFTSLINLFQFPSIDVANVSVQAVGSYSSMLNTSATACDKDDYEDDDSENFGEMTPARRYKLINRQCKPAMQYWGDPDLQPIRSYEIKCLVRSFYHLSSIVNDKFALDIQQLYERNDFFGRICRQFILPPTLCRTFEQCGTPSPIREKILPPRISLRPLANQQLLCYLLIFYAIGWLSNYSFLGLTFFLVFGAILVAIFRAVFMSNDSQHTNPDQSPGLAT